MPVYVALVANGATLRRGEKKELTHGPAISITRQRSIRHNAHPACITSHRHVNLYTDTREQQVFINAVTVVTLDLKVQESPPI